MAAHRTPPGSYGEISVHLLTKKPPADVDVLRKINAPSAVLEWARQNPEELAKLVKAFARQNRKVTETWQAETRLVPRSGGAAQKKRANGSSPDKAKTALREKLAAFGAYDGAVGASKLKPTSTMNQLLDEYISMSLDIPSDGLRQQTIEGKKRVIRRALRARIGEMRIAEFRGPQVDEFRRQMIADGKRHDLKEAFIILRAAMKLAHRWELISINPMSSAEPAPKRSKREIQDSVVYLTPEQVAVVRRDLLQWERDRIGKPGPKPDPQYRWIFETLIGSGARLNEALAIRKQDVMMTNDGPALFIDGTIVRLEGHAPTRQPFTKTDRPRLVALPRATAEALNARLAAISGLPADHLVFFTRTGTPHDHGNIRRALNRGTKGLVEISPEGFSFHPHLTRKAGATAINNAVSPEAAAGFLGHDDLSNLHHYVPADLPQADFSVVDALDELLPLLDDIRT